MDASMMWAVGSSLLSGLGAANDAKRRNKALAQESIAESEAIVKSNVANTIRTGYRVGLLNIQRGLSKRLAQQKGFDITAAGTSAIGAATANAAASGTIGASVDAVQADIHMKQGEAKLQLQEDFEIEQLNMNTQLTELVHQGLDSIKTPTKVKLTSGGEIAGNALLAGLTTFGSLYAKSKFDLGLGGGAGGSSSPGAVDAAGWDSFRSSVMSGAYN